MANEQNLTPLKKGDKIALKAEEDRKTCIISAKVTKAQKKKFDALKAEAGIKSTSLFLRNKLGLD